MNKKKILFLCSGGGGNLRFVHEAIKRNWLPEFEIVEVISDRPCLAIDFAENNGLRNQCIDFNADKQRTLIEQIRFCQPDVIITTVHKILSADFVQEFSGKMINLHYSLLPSFAGSIGTEPVRSAIKYGSCIGGATVHEVTNEVDAGRPKAQAAFSLAPEDIIELVMDIEFRAGCVLLLTALASWDDPARIVWSGRICSLKDRMVLVNPSISLPDDLSQEYFWNLLK